MADIKKLVEATKRIKESSDASVGWPLAAIKAVEAQGIRHPPDVRRLQKEILEELRKDNTIPQRERRR